MNRFKQSILASVIVYLFFSSLPHLLAAATRSASSTVLTLSEAVKAGDLVAVKKIIANRSLINERDREGYTALHHAAIKGEKDIAAELLAHGARVDIRGPGGVYPLHFAAAYGHVSVVELLLTHKALATVYDTVNKSTPLHYAVRRLHLEVMRLLLEAGASVDAIDKGGTALVHAINAGFYPGIRLLLDYHANTQIPNEQGYYPLEIAQQEGDSAIIEALERAGARNATTQERLMRRTKRVLASAFEDPQRLIGTIVLIATIAHWASKKTRGYWRSPLSPLVSYEPPIIQAVKEDNVTVVEKLLAPHGAEQQKKIVNEKNYNGETALHYALTQRIAALLIRAGADVNALSKDGTTPLHTAVAKRKLPVIKYLLQHGGRVDIADKIVGTPFHYLFRPQMPNQESALNEMVFQQQDPSTFFFRGVNPFDTEEAKEVARVLCDADDKMGRNAQKIKNAKGYDAVEVQNKLSKAWLIFLGFGSRYPHEVVEKPLKDIEEALQ